MQRQPTYLAVFPPADGATNFARDAVLLAEARRRGEQLVRVYSWSAPALSVGRNERIVGRFDSDRAAAAGLQIVRRTTGGRALLHWRELTYAIAAPATPDEPLAATFASIAALLVGALRRLGVAAGTASSPPPLRPDSGAPCFAQPSVGEIVVEGRKLVASAQFRDAGAYLQHGSILIDDDQPLLLAARSHGAELPGLARPATLRELLGRAPDPTEFCDALESALEARSGVLPVRVAAETLNPPAAVASERARFTDPAWTWRR